MLPLWYALARLKPAAIVSPSRDGDILAAWLVGLGYGEVLRGSSSRGGSDALQRAVGVLAARSVLITPDGPRGPARQAKAGAMLAAIRGNVPLIAAGWSASRAVTIGSWDHMLVPAPFARVEIRFARFDVGSFAPGERIGDDALHRLAAAIDAVSAAAGH